MPLIHSSSKEAFSRNVSAEISSGRPRDQALAIAYRIKRERASGGRVHNGAIMSAVPGRTDNHPMAVGSGAYVLPADHVSSMGQGNTAAGMSVLNNIFGPSGPYGIGKSPSIRRGAGVPKPPSLKTRGVARAEGCFAPETELGLVYPYRADLEKNDVFPDQSDASDPNGPISPVDIMAAGGEFVIPPEYVAAVGNGDMKRGHEILDKWVVSNRMNHIKTLSKLPGRAKS